MQNRGKIKKYSEEDIFYQKENSLESNMRNISLKNNQSLSDRSFKREKFVTNYVKVLTGEKEVHKYSVTFSIDIQSSGVRYSLLSQHDDILGKYKCFDGSILYLTEVLEEDDIFLQSVFQREQINVTIKISYLETSLLSETPQIVSIILKRILRYVKLQRIGKGYYCPELKINIDQYNLSLWPGYSTACRQCEGGILWSIEPSFKVLRQECVLDIMSDLYFKSKDFRTDLTRQIVGSVIMTRYNNKTYRIDDIAWDKSPKDTFELHTGQEISYIDYYKQVYNLDISDTDQPLLINVPKVNNRLTNSKNIKNTMSLIYLIPEFCFSTGITDTMREDHRLMKDLSRSFHSSASEKCKSIKSLIDIVCKNEECKKELAFWGIKISSTMHEVEGVTFKPEPIFDGSGDKPICVDPTRGFMNGMKNLQPLSCPKLEEWIVVHTQRDTSVMNKFMSSLESAVRSCNLSFCPPEIITIPSDSTDMYVKAIKQEISKRSLDLVLCIFPSQREDRYSAFKKLLSVQFGIPSQAVLTRTLNNPQKLNTVSNRIALQMNCKLGGELWYVDLKQNSIMVIGVDVYHGTGGGKSSSTVGFVSSTNDSLTKWFSRVAFQAQSHEMFESFRTFVQQALSKYYEVNQTLPRKIVVLRDGVGLGQVSSLEEIEVKPVLEALSSFADNYSPKLLFTCINKRIKTRIFSQIDRSGLGNPPPGSVIDTSITSTRMPNFFLVSQNFSQGTVQPISVFIIYNSTKLSLQQIQSFVYKCTYLYYNWPGAVRVPAPCLYAHKVANFAGQYLHGEAATILSDKLYFL